MIPDPEDREFDDDEDVELGKGIEPTPGGLAHWVAEQYFGDDRFELVEVEEPGQLDEESVRVKFICNDETHFMMSVLAEDAIVRIGLATEDQDLVDRIEEATENAGGGLTDLMAEGMGADEDLEHAVEHWHDDMDYFCCDIQYQSADDLSSDVLRDEVIYYLDGFFSAFYHYVFEEE